jgi:hypothetical protein
MLHLGTKSLNAWTSSVPTYLCARYNFTLAPTSNLGCTNVFLYLVRHILGIYFEGLFCIVLTTYHFKFQRASPRFLFVSPFASPNNHHQRCGKWRTKNPGYTRGEVWQHAELESGELLGIAMRQGGVVRTMEKGGLVFVDARWEWTEPHSRRLRVRVTVRKHLAELPNGKKIGFCATVKGLALSASFPCYLYASTSSTLSTTFLLPC